MDKYLPLSRLMQTKLEGRAWDGVAAIRQNGEAIRWGAFAESVRTAASVFLRSEAKNFLLASEDVYAFMTGWMALALAGKNIVIASNLRPAALAAAVETCDGGAVTAEAFASVGHDARFESAVSFPPWDGDRLTVTLYTSGSTGEAVPVCKPIAAFEAEVNALHRRWGGRVRDGIFASSVAHYHTYGLLFQMLWPLCAGNAIWLSRILHPEELSACALGGAVCLISGPVFLNRYADMTESSRLDALPGFVTSSGSALSAETSKRMAAKLCFPVTEFYGSTETGGVAYREGDAVWSCLDDVEIRQDERRRFFVRSPFTGVDGWRETADVVDVVGPGRFLLRGRGDTIVKLYGKRVSLCRLEACCAETPWMEAAKILFLGETERPKGVAVLSEEGKTVLARQGKAAFVKEIRARLNASFDAEVIPRTWRFIDRFPVNETGKIPRERLMELFKESAADA